MSVANATLLDYETAVSHDITVLASSSDGSTASETFTINVVNYEPPNQPPVAHDDALSATATEDGSWTFSANDLLGNDYDPDVDDVLALTNLVSPAGSITDNGDQTYTFTPFDPTSVGAVDIIYAISDGEGGEDTATANFSVAPYVAPNEAPTADDSVTFTMSEDGTLTISEADLLGSSSDPDNPEDLHVVNLALGEGASGSLTPNDAAAPEGTRTWTYTPADDFNGSVALSYEVSDGELTDTVQTSITVNSLPDSPEVIGSVSLGSIQEDGSIMVTEAQLLSNTSDSDTDLSQLSIGSVTAVYPDGAEVSLTQQTVDIYEFDQTFTGDLTPLYEDLTNAVEVSGVYGSTASSSGPDHVIVSSDEGTFAYMRMVSVDPGTQSEVVTYTSGFAVVDSGLDGTFWQFDPAQDFSGDITFNYTVTDGETDPVAASATLHVAEVPDTPLIEGDMSLSLIHI